MMSDGLFSSVWAPWRLASGARFPLTALGLVMSYPTTLFPLKLAMNSVGVTLLLLLLSSVTRTFTLSVSDPPFPSSTVSWNDRASAVVGATKLTVSVFAPARVTEVPAVCVHEKLSVSPSGSELPAPLSVTAELTLTVRSAPALAVGAALPCTTGGGVHACPIDRPMVIISISRPTMRILLFHPTRLLFLI